VIEGLVRSESGKIHIASCVKVKLLKEPLPVPRERALERYRWAMCCNRESASCSRVSDRVESHVSACELAERRNLDLSRTTAF
jgi:hypothetical protein